MTLSEASSAYHTRGTIMRRRFTQTEVYYLNTLPAVERASMDRITYSKEFQVRCMAQYLRGNGPTSIFASAGLDPKIVGGKRAMLIEGARRVGKSTLAQEFAQHEYEGHLVIDAEHRHGYFATISQLRPRTSWPG